MSSPLSPTLAADVQQDVVHRAVVQARKVIDQRRSQRRSPFFCPVMLGRDAEGLVRMPAYVRDISMEGIGLLHTTPVRQGDIVTAYFETDDKLQLKIRIHWCKDLSVDWYLSGGRFSGIQDDE